MPLARYGRLCPSSGSHCGDSYHCIDLDAGLLPIFALRLLLQEQDLEGCFFSAASLRPPTLGLNTLMGLKFAVQHTVAIATYPQHP